MFVQSIKSGVGHAIEQQVSTPILTSQVQNCCRLQPQVQLSEDSKLKRVVLSTNEVAEIFFVVAGKAARQKFLYLVTMSPALGNPTCCLDVSGHCVVFCISQLSVALCLDGTIHLVYSGEDRHTVLDVSQHKGRLMQSCCQLRQCVRRCVSCHVPLKGVYCTSGTTTPWRVHVFSVCYC